MQTFSCFSCSFLPDTPWEHWLVRVRIQSSQHHQINSQTITTPRSGEPVIASPVSSCENPKYIYDASKLEPTSCSCGEARGPWPCKKFFIFLTLDLVLNKEKEFMIRFSDFYYGCCRLFSVEQIGAILAIIYRFIFRHLILENSL